MEIPSSASTCYRRWREAPCYTDRERAALGWTEALTRLSEGHVHESAYEALKTDFTVWREQCLGRIPNQLPSRRGAAPRLDRRPRNRKKSRSTVQALSKGLVQLWRR